jgi:hypothetical protein
MMTDLTKYLFEDDKTILDLIEAENPALKDASLYAKQVAIETFEKCDFLGIPKFDAQDQSFTCCDQVFKLRAFTSLGDREYFHEQPIRTETEVRDALQVPASIKFRDPSVMDVLRKTKYLNHYRFDNAGEDLPRICFSPEDLEVAPGSVKLIQNPALDILMTKWGHLNNKFLDRKKYITIGRKKRKMSDVNFDFKPREEKKKSRKNVYLPGKIPIQGARTGPRSEFIWTGRMRFYKNWIYEVQHDDGTLAEVRLSSLMKPKYSNYRSIMFSAICEKYKSWTYPCQILGDAFIKVPKVRNQMPAITTEDVWNNYLWE